VIGPSKVKRGPRSNWELRASSENVMKMYLIGLGAALLIAIALFFGVRAANEDMREAGQPPVEQLQQPNREAGVENEDGGPFRQ
jgi:hypothetical protein